MSTAASPTPVPTASAVKQPTMKVANIILGLSKGHEVGLKGVTPAEVLLLVAEHHTNYGGDPVISLEEQKEEVKRTNDEEVARLRSKYALVKVNALFQGAIPNLPDSFAKAREIGIKMVLPTQKLAETRII